MKVWDKVPMIAALLLAAVAALTSGDAEARREVAGFVVEVLSPPATDSLSGTDYLTESMSASVWPLPPPQAAGTLEDRQD